MCLRKKKACHDISFFLLADFGLATPLNRVNTNRLGTAKVTKYHLVSIATDH